METKKHTVDVIPDCIMETLEAYDVRFLGGETPSVSGVVHADAYMAERDAKLAFFEFESFTDGGGDMIIPIEIHEGRLGDPKSWAEAFRKSMGEFDPWEEAHLWLDENGNPIPDRGIPYTTGFEVYKDFVDWKSDMLDPLLDDLDKACIAAPIENLFDATTRFSARESGSRVREPEIAGAPR